VDDPIVVLENSSRSRDDLRPHAAGLRRWRRRERSQLQQPGAIPVIGGLITSTFLTLLVVPVGYALLMGRCGKKGG
jgi:multidrug efflux pump subunit AcrB